MTSTPPTYDDLIHRAERAWKTGGLDEGPALETLEALAASLGSVPLVRTEGLQRLPDGPAPLVIEACLTPGVTSSRRDIRREEVAAHRQVVFLEVLLCPFAQVAEARWYLLHPGDERVETYWYPALDKHWMLARGELSYALRRLYPAAQERGIAMLSPELTGREARLAPADGPPAAARPLSLRGWLFHGAEQRDALARRGPDQVPAPAQTPLARYPRATARAERRADPAEWVEVTISLVDPRDLDRPSEYFTPAPTYAPAAVALGEGLPRERLVRGWESGVATGSSYALRSHSGQPRPAVVLWALAGCLQEGGEGVSRATVAATRAALGDASPQPEDAEWQVTSVSLEPADADGP